jgi:hypothetical protein
MLADELLNHVRQGCKDRAHDRYGFLSDGQKQFGGFACANRMGHRWSELSHERVADENGNGADDDIHLMNTMANRALSGSSAVGPGFHHLRGGDGIGPESPDFHFFTKALLDLFDDSGTNTGPLAVYYCYSNQVPRHESSFLPAQCGAEPGSSP